MRSFPVSIVRGKLATVTLSGVVIDYTTSEPRARVVRLHDKHGNLITSTQSAAIDGAYSITLTGNENDEFEIIVQGEYGERGEILNHVVGEINV